MKPRIWMQFFFLLATAFTVLKCAHREAAEPIKTTARKQASLTQVEANFRAKIVSDLSYDLTFDLTTDGDTYSGQMVAEFTALVGGRDLRVDFAEGQTSRVAINGKPVIGNQHPHYVVIPGKLIQAGRQRLEIDFTQTYSRQGRGLNKFVDPVDKNTYLYTDFEPYDANRAFPCFDQPDLKATYTLKVLAPKSWQVISSVREKEVVTKDGGQLWTFPRSAKYSTYIFPLHAGPYAKWEDKTFRYPLRLFARQSLAKYVNPNEWFPITRHGFDFFEKYFDYAYPYKKYDQILAPEFNSGAMENVAAVTFTERFVGRGAKTRAQIRSLANTILHELAHMWFGNLVTMRWWGDLWLNESFATYMATVAMAASPDFKESWHHFFAGKAGAYYEDQLETTHPVVAKVNDTSEAFNSFDSITYGKGASVLKQLSYTLGERTFQKGLSVYFHRFAEKNTELKDFMSALEEASDRELEQWQKVWLESAGLNAITTQFECHDGKVSQFAILQSAPSGQAIARPHALEVALLTRTNGVMRAESQFQVQINESTNYIPEAVGRPCPHAVYPNLNDHGYVKVILDEKSLAGIKNSMNEIQDPLLRHQVWHALWDMARDARLSIVDFAQLLSPESLSKENNDLILRQLTQNVGSLLYYYQLAPNLKASAFPALQAQIEQTIWQRLQSAAAGSNDQLIWFDAFVGNANTDTAVQNAKQLLSGKISLRGLQIDQDRRWNLINLIARSSASDANQWIESESKRDRSNKGVEERVASLASRPLFAEKMRWIDELKSEKSTYSFSQLRYAVWNIFPRSQSDLRERYAPQFFKDMLLVNNSRDMMVAGMFTSLAPHECDSNSEGKLRQFLKENHRNLQVVVSKRLTNAAEESERCRKIIAFTQKKDN